MAWVRLCFAIPSLVGIDLAIDLHMPKKLHLVSKSIETLFQPLLACSTNVMQALENGLRLLLPVLSMILFLLRQGHIFHSSDHLWELKPNPFCYILNVSYFFALVLPTLLLNFLGSFRDMRVLSRVPVSENVVSYHFFVVNNAAQRQRNQNQA